MAKPQKSSTAFPDDMTSSQFAALVAKGFDVVAEEARARAKSAKTPATAAAFREWAEAAEDAKTAWERNGGSTAESATQMLDAAIEATIIAGASTPPGAADAQVSGGLVSQWLRILKQADPGALRRKPKDVEAFVRRLAIEMMLPDNPDREDVAAAAQLNDCAAVLLVSPEAQRTPDDVLNATMMLLSDSEREIGRNLTATRASIAALAMVRPVAPKAKPPKAKPAPKPQASRAPAFSLKMPLPERVVVPQTKAAPFPSIGLGPFGPTGDAIMQGIQALDGAVRDVGRAIEHINDARAAVPKPRAKPASTFWQDLFKKAHS